MNKHKICPSLFSNVSTLSSNSKLKEVFVFSNNFVATKKFLLTNQYMFTPYRFANCFCVFADDNDIEIFSNLDFVTYISPNSNVLSLNCEKKFINLNKITENKHLGKNQTICFIDTGIHPHFDFVFPKNRILKFVDLINNKTQPYDDNGHGTFVAGIAAGSGIISKTNIGFSPQSNIVAIKALNHNGNSNSNIILDAMQWILQHHKIYNIGIVCMSFGADVEEFNPLSKGAEALWKCGITVVAAAGNSGPKPESIKSPGNSPYIITVGGLDVEKFDVAEFSSRGPTIYGTKPDLLAPAVNLTSCNNKFLPYINMSGTSVAAPIIAGICADLKCKYPNITNNQIKEFLLSHCKKVTGDINKEGAGYLCFWIYKILVLCYNENMIEFKNVSIQYIKDFHSLLNENFCIQNNSLLTNNIVNSASAVMRIISKIDTRYSGQILIDNIDIKRIKNKDINVAYIPEIPTLFESKNIFYNLYYPLKIRKINKISAKNIINDVFFKYKLNNFINFNDIEKIKINKLDYSLKKIICLIRATLWQPKYILIENFFKDLDKDLSDIANQIISDVSQHSTIIAFEEADNSAYQNFEKINLNNK